MNEYFQIEQTAVRFLAADDKNDVLQQLARAFHEAYQIDAVAALEALEERERLGSTGFGRGYAVPHNRIAGVERPMVVLVRLAKPVDFDAADDLPVSLVFGLLSPESGGVAHLHALAAISRLMRDETMHRRLMAAPDADAMFALLTNVIDRDAA